LRNVDWGQVALLVAVVVPSVILHEVSHGFVANLLGDDTAKRAGRLTLNPLAHIDPFGTVLLPLLLSLSGVGAFGYAKPVPVNPRKLRNPRQHSLYVSLAGPATNLTLAAASVVVLRLGYRDVVRLAAQLQAPELLSGAARFLFWLALVNVILAVFNLLPIPPLDGSALIERVLPRSWWPAWLKWRQWGFGVLLLLIFVVPGSLNRVFDPAIDFFLRLLR
jgi:Zn-dependent protease